MDFFSKSAQVSPFAMCLKQQSLWVSQPMKNIQCSWPDCWADLKKRNTLHRTLLSLFNDCETIVECWCGAVKSVLTTTLNAEVWGLGGLFRTQVMNTVEAVKSANSCMEMSASPNSGVAGSSLGLCFLSSMFAHIHVSTWQSPSGADWEVAFN